MRWIKHLSKSRKDEKLSAVLEDMGAEGYGVFWLIIECISEVMENGRMEPQLTYSGLQWSHELHISVRKFHSISQRLAKDRLIVLISSSDRFKIYVPNIVKYKDEYSKKSGGCPDSKADTEREQNTPKVPAAKPAAVEAENPVTDRVRNIAKLMVFRHPALRCNLSAFAVEGKLNIILKRHATRTTAAFKLDLLDGINEWHAEQCASYQWTKDGGEFAQGLEKFLAPTLDRYMKPSGQASLPELWLGERNGAPNPGLVGGDD